MSAVPEPVCEGREIRVRGLVQGTGFRPGVWRLAQEYGLCGYVCNDAGGVLIHAWGPPTALDRFAARLREQPPPLARIEAIDTAPLSGPVLYEDFIIAPSGGGTVHTGVPADAATCAACLNEVLEPADRRYRYPFTACAHCGPRMSIITAVPYDRSHTSMGDFPLCPVCRREYEDPGDRRFHAQATACPACGPRLTLTVLAPEGRGVEPETARLLAEARSGRDPVQAAAYLLRRGAIVAVKGLGGYHLACDARAAGPVTRLRRRKRRYGKAFALMARDAAMVRRYCRMSAEEQQLLESAAAPIVILDALSYAAGAQYLAAAVAPGQRTLGFMLPYTPLHHLLLRDCGGPIVLTSGNLSDEPLCIDDEEARIGLAGIADFILAHDRRIVNRMDDSVARVMAGAPRLLRRARGYAPAPLAMPPGFEAAPPVLALGGEFKGSFCMVHGGAALLSPHLGDLERPAALANCQQGLSLYAALFEHTPQAVAVDLHPDYLSARLGRALAVERGVRVIPVQHHHAHIAACMAEHGVPLDGGPVLGVALDGLGYGDDGGLWGGEFLLADYRGALRLGRLRPVALPGGARAVREPWRCAYAHLRTAMEWAEAAGRYRGLPLIRFLAARPLPTLDAMMQHGVNAPLASSCGRLFDAAAAAVGIHCDAVAYEGQAAVEFETCVDRAALGRPGYRLEVGGAGGLATLDTAPLWPALLGDVKRGVPVPEIAAHFHRGLSDAVIRLAAGLAAPRGITTIALSGGVVQNRILLELLTAGLQAGGFTVLSPSRLPANDGGLSLGQAAVAAARLMVMDAVRVAPQL